MHGQHLNNNNMAVMYLCERTILLLISIWILMRWNGNDNENDTSVNDEDAKDMIITIMMM